MHYGRYGIAPHLTEYPRRLESAPHFDGINPHFDGISPSYDGIDSDLEGMSLHIKTIAKHISNRLNIIDAKCFNIKTLWFISINHAGLC